MARPKTNTVEYFPMYSHNSRTCEMLESKFGIVGYAFFYKLLQLLATENGHFYDARDPMDIEFLEQKLCGGEVSVTEILDTMSKWNKIDQKLWDKRIIWYQGFIDTLAPVYKKRDRDIPTIQDVYVALNISGCESLVSGTKTIVSGTENSNNPEFPCRTVTESTQSKVKESKVKEIQQQQQHVQKSNSNNSQKKSESSLFNSFQEDSTPLEVVQSLNNGASLERLDESIKFVNESLEQMKSDGAIHFFKSNKEAFDVLSLMCSFQKSKQNRRMNREVIHNLPSYAKGMRKNILSNNEEPSDMVESLKEYLKNLESKRNMRLHDEQMKTS